MRCWFLVGLSIALPLAADPVTLHVDLIEGRFLSFRLQSHYETPVTKFEVAADFGEHPELGCGHTVEVKRPEDLHPAGTCSLPTDPKTGKVSGMTWKTRIVYVEFADGMCWTPKR
jgi:hypothetical protein